MVCCMATSWSLISETIRAWNSDKVPRLAAALAYYVIFAITPILIIVVAIAGTLLGEQNVQREIFSQIASYIGKDESLYLQSLIKNFHHPQSGLAATVVGVITLIIGSIGFFSQLQDALNTIWHCQPEHLGLIGRLKKYSFNLLLVFCTGIVVLMSIMVNSLVTALTGIFGIVFPIPNLFFQLINQLVVLAILTVIFSMAYRFIPHTKLPMRNVGIGSFITSLLFVFGTWLLSEYLGQVGYRTIYGAAGSVIIILIWVYYSAQIFLIGAEFIKVYSMKKTK